MLIALLLGYTVATKAQSVADIQDTIAAYAPHVPALNRWTEANGKVFWGLGDTRFTHESQDSVISWIVNYPTESNDYYAKIGRWLGVIGVIEASGLSDADKDKYYDIEAVWIMIHAND